MALGIRGFNPIWAEFDLQGNIFDDTYYMFVLENTIPYIPSIVYHDPDLNTPWTNPIQFLGNGTLPVDIFFEGNKVYRLEFRQGNTQQDPLIYEVNDYMPGDGGSTPIDNVAFVSSNQITNPQFSLISFKSPFTLSATNPDPIEVAPGWFLELEGTGTVQLTQVPLNNSNENPSNAPYALQITLSGWTADSVFLRQRFQQNGMLWTSSPAVTKYVSSTITTRLDGSPQSITATLVDSTAATLTTVLSTPVNSVWNEFTGYGQMPETSNADIPPAAYIDYKLALPSNIDIYVTSFQLVVQDLPVEPAFDQDSIERQVDHTFHYYRNSLLLQPKESILVGWDFGLNPWQSRSTAQSNVATFAYTADQAIIIQQAYVNSTTMNNVSVGQGTVAQNYGFKVQAVTATNQFALIQYIDPASLRPYWGSTLSSLVKLSTLKQSGGDLKVKMRLIYRASLPSALSQTEPVASWSALGEPVFSGGWTAIVPKNDPVYNLTTGDATLTFEGFTLPASSNAAMTLGVVIYTLNPMVETGTPDYILFKKASLVPNEFAIDCNPMPFDEVLRQCQYYYESSYPIGVVPGTINTESSAISTQGGSGTAMYARSFALPIKTLKRAAVTTGKISFYSPITGTIGKVRGVLWGATTQIFDDDLSILNTDGSRFWSLLTSGQKNIIYEVTTGASIATGVGVTSPDPDSFIYYHFTLNARLGV